MYTPLACLCYKKKSSNKFSQKKYSVYRKSRSNEQVERNKKRHSLTILKDTLTFPKTCSAEPPAALRYKIICSLDIQPPLRTPELKGDRCTCLKHNGLKQTSQSPFPLQGRCILPVREHPAPCMLRGNCLLSTTYCGSSSLLTLYSRFLQTPP